MVVVYFDPEGYRQEVLEGQGDLVSGFIIPIIHIVTPNYPHY